MKQIGDRLDDLEKGLEDLRKGIPALVRSGIEKFIADEKAKAIQAEAPQPSGLTPENNLMPKAPVVSEESHAS